MFYERRFPVAAPYKYRGEIDLSGTLAVYTKDLPPLPKNKITKIYKKQLTNCEVTLESPDLDGCILIIVDFLTMK